MFDGFWSGILGGFVGPRIARVLRRFKYSTLFLAGAIGTLGALFVGVALKKGWEFAWAALLANAATPTGILLPIGGGAFCVFLVWIYTIGQPENPNKGN
jgi:hypothetical protein